MKPWKSIPGCPSEPWYTTIPLGQNTLNRLLKQMLNEANIDSTNKSNHSLRATARMCLVN